MLATCVLIVPLCLGLGLVFDYLKKVDVAGHLGGKVQSTTAQVRLGRKVWNGAAEVLATMDRNIDPCTDFYEYACAGWIEKTKTPAWPWSRGFSVVETTTNGQLLELLRHVGGQQDPRRKVLEEFFAACMDTTAINAVGVKPAQAFFDEIGSISNREQYFQIVAKAQTFGVPGLFLLTVEPDAKKPRSNMAQLYQAGLGMPGKIFYTSDQLGGIRNAYKDYMRKMHLLVDSDEATAAKRTDEVFAFEVELASISAPPDDVANSTKNYNPTGFAELPRDVPWSTMFEAMSVARPTTVNLKTPAFFARVGALIERTDLAVLRNHIRWQVLNANAPLMSDTFFVPNYEFYTTKLRGNQSPPLRQLFCVNQCKSNFGELLAQYYAKEHYDPASEPALEQLIDRGLKPAFLRRLAQLEWMSSATQERARTKAEVVTHQIGTPDSSVDFNPSQLRRGSFYERSIAVSKALFAKEMTDAGRPVASNQWYAPAYVTNAYYDPTQNNIVVPAGIIHPPFFDLEAPEVFNYGALGTILGHEFTHGFDANGARCDADGTLEDWWDHDSKAAFESRAGCIVNQYNRYAALPGLNVNGALTLNENIADNGGLALAWDAFVHWKATQDQSPVSLVEGLSIDQLFFVVFAQQWCTIDSDQSLQMTVSSDVHAPARFRVNGSVSNTPQFAAAFACKLNAPMAPKDRCTIW